MKRSALLPTLAILAVALAGCSSSPEPEAPVGTTPAAGASATQGLAIDLYMNPDPPQSGDNEITVQVKSPDGTPLADANVTAVFYMAAMPSMNMPEMRSTFALEPTGNGSYHGKGSLSMGGSWDVTVAVTRNGEKLGTGKFAVTAH